MAGSSSTKSELVRIAWPIVGLLALGLAMAVDGRGIAVESEAAWQAGATTVLAAEHGRSQRSDSAR